MRHIYTHEHPSPRMTPRKIEAGMVDYTLEKVVRVLGEYLSSERSSRIEQVLDGRTYGVVTVLQGLIDGRNVSAVARTAEALGFQEMHVIAAEGTLSLGAKAGQGCQKWLDIWHWTEGGACIAHLRDLGYRIVAMSDHPGAVPIEQIDFTQQTAIVFGNERDGLTPEIIDASDARAWIPMSGFTRSFNVSVAAAITLHYAHMQRCRLLGKSGFLTEEERTMLRALFYLHGVEHSEQLLKMASG